MQPNQPNQSQQPSWQYVGEAKQSSQSVQSTSQNESYQWSASEFIAYQKNAGWYLLLILVICVISGLVFIITRDLISTVSIIFAGILFMIFAARKPRVLEYQIDKNGISIGQKLYSYSNLKSFSIINEGAMRSISLYPLQRFMPSISIYFEPQEEPNIIDALANYLPQEDKKQDVIDRLMHRIRF